MNDNNVSGGIMVTGNYPGKASNIEELRQDMEKMLSFIPDKHKISLHAIYAKNTNGIDLDKIQPKHFEGWVSWAKKMALVLILIQHYFLIQNQVAPSH